MPLADVFNSDAFGLVSLTTAINKLPYHPMRIGQMGIFEDMGISTVSAMFEEDAGILSLIPSVPRGAPATQARNTKRTARSITVPHIPLEDRILAASIQGVRKFGSESELESVTNVVNDHLQKMRNSQEVTLEHMRAGALAGIVYDGDGSTVLYNLFTEFGVSASSDVDFVLGTDTTNIAGKVLTVVGEIEDALGATPYDHIHALCSPTWFAKFVAHPAVAFAYQYYRENEFAREDQRKGFTYQGVTFEQYRGTIGTKAFITAGDARFFPVGVPELYKTIYAPGDFMETVNTIGLPMYAKQEPLPFDRGITLHVQSNPLPVCTRPTVLVRGYSSN